MAGIVPFPAGRTPGRKQWNIRDRKSIKRLRSQLAEDGCPESQLVLAKQLLEEKSSEDIDNEVNARLGVFWLTKASEQGNVEATDILRQCLDSGEGITEQNYLDVKTCLNTLQNEKLAKRAAKEMFISLSDGQDFITSEQLSRRMSRINIYDGQTTPSTDEKKKKKTNCVLREAGDEGVEDNIEDDEDEVLEKSADDAPCGWSERRENVGEKLTEDLLENAASTYSRGELPIVHRIQDSNNRQIEKLNYLQKALLHPVLTLQDIYMKFLDKFSSRHRYTLIPNFQQCQLIIFFIIYSLVTFDNVTSAIPSLCYYLSFFLMVFSTFYMLQSKKEYNHFRVWSRLFLSYDRDGSLNTDDAEFEYCKKNLRPYGLFFMSLLVNLLVYPFVSEMWMPQSEFAVLAFSFTFLTLYSFHEKSSASNIDYMTFFSFGINVLAKYPYDTDGVVRQTWRFLDLELPNLQEYGLPCFASYVVCNGIEFCLNFKAFFYLLMPGIFLKLASRDNWKGTYKVLIPHCVTLAWWQIAVLCCQGATLYGLIRSALALVGLVMFLPLVSLTTLVLPVLAVMKHFTEVAFDLRTAATTALAVIPLAIGYFLNKRRGVQLGAYFSKVQILLAVIAGCFLIIPPATKYLSSVDETGDRERMQVKQLLTWDQYTDVCLHDTNLAVTQIECGLLQGVHVNWEGIVEQVHVVKIHNTLAKAIDVLPDLIKNKLYCIYGDSYQEDCFNTKKDSQLCQIIKQIRTKSKCHLQAWNKYEFEIIIKMKSNHWNSGESIVKLLADDGMKNFTLNLKTKDHIWFAGVLKNAGGSQVVVTADEIGCIYCNNNNLSNVKKSYRQIDIAHVLYVGVKYVLNFILNPIVIFK